MSEDPLKLIHPILVDRNDRKFMERLELGGLIPDLPVHLDGELQVFDGCIGVPSSFDDSRDGDERGIRSSDDLGQFL